jgi:plasmid stabilization system protein ParE
LTNAYEYIKQDSPSSAKALAERIIKSIDMASEHPEIGRPGRVETTREVIVPHSPFIVVYRYKKDTVEIITIFHTSRKWVDGF